MTGEVVPLGDPRDEEARLMAKIEDIPADTTIRLTAELDRLFRLEGCKPACHGCGRPIKVGRLMKLAEIDGRDEMLCGRCTTAGMKRARERRLRAAEKERSASAWWARAAVARARAKRRYQSSLGMTPGSGYSRPHKKQV